MYNILQCLQFPSHLPLCLPLGQEFYFSFCLCNCLCLSLCWFWDHMWQYSGLPSALLLRVLSQSCSQYHMGCQGSDSSWPSARQTASLLHYGSSPRHSLYHTNIRTARDSVGWYLGSEFRSPWRDISRHELVPQGIPTHPCSTQRHLFAEP